MDQPWSESLQMTKVFDFQSMTARPFHRNVCLQGDSGVGVSYRLGQRDYLVGIAGFRDKSCAQGAPTGFTSVEFYVPWILTVMEQQEGVASLGEWLSKN